MKSDGHSFLSELSGILKEGMLKVEKTEDILSPCT